MDQSGCLLLAAAAVVTKERNFRDIDVSIPTMDIPTPMDPWILLRSLLHLVLSYHQQVRVHHEPEGNTAEVEVTVVVNSHQFRNFAKLREAFEVNEYPYHPDVPQVWLLFLQ